MSLSLDSIGNNRLGVASEKLLKKELENKFSENASSVENELKGDAVTISEKGRALAKKITSLEESDEQAGKTAKKDAKQVKKERASESGGNKSALDKLIETLKKKIKVVEQEIQSLKGSNMHEKAKQSMLSAKTEELTLLNGQLQSAMAQKMKAAQGAAKA
ncbi:hypothetical protein [Halodesulfovibrio spirochaetisodalis]|uniref:Uncharacterized protein n=1 Tax=Halodesulfovibrio spirochaetisodalis TaxID=1560234 RepID=A0A1B7XG60_9BACT|nr:hypothetical protein [Halodesulfovibrio spirochaetisodalis]OBQ54504.1 hypothetical protein SP90_05470 [Halodesulfovibrio spirochaetisodalis]